MVRRQSSAGYDSRRLAESGEHLRARPRQAFTGTDVEGDSLPAPRIDLQSHCSEGLYLRVRRHPFLFAVVAELPANEILLFQRRDCLQDLDLLIADGFGVHSDRGLHCEVAQDLKEMVLD